MFALRFGGVYYSARVWLNATYLGGHEGYLALSSTSPISS